MYYILYYSSYIILKHNGDAYKLNLCLTDRQTVQHILETTILF